jgi:hypothetical protein
MKIVFPWNFSLEPPLILNLGEYLIVKVLEENTIYFYSSQGGKISLAFYLILG